jgi:mRNA interferase YafQ
VRQLKKRGYDIGKLDCVVGLLAEGVTLPPQCHDHTLVGNWEGHRECHIAPDWLLIYYIKEETLVLTLTRTGSHSDLF